MPRRRRHDVVALLALVVTVAACQADTGDAGCQLTNQVTLPGTPLTLLQSARLDQIGGGYFLLGSDGSNVRWAKVSTDYGGMLTGEEAYALPPEATVVYFAMAGVAAPADTVLIGYLGTDAEGNGTLQVIPVPADGSAPTSAATTVQTFPGGVPPASSVTMSSSRAGMNAGLAWIDNASRQVLFTNVNGAGMATGAPISTTSTAGAPFSCLRFSPGKDDFTVVYHATTTNTPGAYPGWVIAEANEGGSVDSAVTQLGFSSATSLDGCVQVAPVDGGYALTWQDNEGDWLATYVAQSNLVSTPTLFASASSSGGSYLQPPMVGLAPFGTDYGVLVSQARDVELWRVNGTGTRQPGALVFPSINGTFGDVSALPIANALRVTYADYTSAPGVSPVMGSRVLTDAVCY